MTKNLAVLEDFQCFTEFEIQIGLNSPGLNSQTDRHRQTDGRRMVRHKKIIALDLKITSI